MVVPSPTAIATSLAQVLSLVRVNTNVTGTPFFTVILFGLKPWLVTSIAMGVGAATTTGAGGAGEGTGFAGAGAGFAGAGFVASAVLVGLPASALLSQAFDVPTAESEIATAVEATTSKIGFISEYFLDWLAAVWLHVHMLVADPDNAIGCTARDDLGRHDTSSNVDDEYFAATLIGNKNFCTRRLKREPMGFYASRDFCEFGV